MSLRQRQSLNEMNVDSVLGHCKYLKGLLREKWGTVFHNDKAVYKGKKEQLLGSIQLRYGRTRDSAARNNGKMEHNATENH
jgi:uncharacterized protein YjbJ (UPF0337 family)